MTRYRITPWRTQTDLLEIRQQLYSTNDQDTARRQRAVERVMAWKLRGNLPHAVESTALLVDAILHHSIVANSSFSIRAVYSAAFCRFVTGFCDIGRHKERALEPSSMLEIAKQIDMPVEFVALRHEATHEELPGVQRLVTATRQALEWLWRVYWSRLEEPEDSETREESVRAFKAEVAVILRGFRRSRRDSIRNNTQSSPEQLAEMARTCDAFVAVCKGSRSRIEILASILVEERLLFPMSRGLRSPLEGAFLIWDDMLKSLSLRLNGFMRSLAVAFLESITKSTDIEPQTDIEKEALTMWLFHILDDGARSHENKAVEAEVMKLCCLYPGYWTRRIGRELLKLGNSDLRADWEDLFNASAIGVVDEKGSTVVAATELPSADRSSSEEMTISADLNQVEDVEGDEIRSWRRAVTSPSLPLGIAQMHSQKY